MVLQIWFWWDLPLWKCESDHRFQNYATLKYEEFGREIQGQLVRNTYQRTGDKYKVSLWGIQFNGTTPWCWFGQKYPGNYTLQCKCKHKYKCANTNTQIQSRKYKYRHKYKYAVTMAIPRSFRKLNSDGFWLWRNANPTRRSEVRTVWIFSSAVPAGGFSQAGSADEQLKKSNFLIEFKSIG